VRGDLLSGLPDGVQALLAAPPLAEKRLLELSLTWPSLSPVRADMADALRLFVITWDPLEQLARRPGAVATVNADPSGVEMVIYVPCWSLAGLASEYDGTVAGGLGALAGSALLIAETHEQAVRSGSYPDLVIQGGAPDLLTVQAGGAALGTPEIRLVSPGWEEIGLGAITDIVQRAFGTVDLDRSPVELAASRTPSPGCPACKGRRFGFPGELAGSRDRMCTQHLREASALINRRLARANASNPDGWGSLADASARLERPHLPNGLATRLVGAEQGIYVVPEPDMLAERAALVIEAAGWFPGRPRDLSLALGTEPEAAGQRPDWLATLVLDLGRAGLGIDAATVGDALSRVDPDNAAFHNADVAVALAHAGLREQARARVASMLARWPDNFWCRVHAGDALAALGDLDGAEAHFATAVRMAEDAEDFASDSDAAERLRELRRRESAESEPAPRRGQRRQPRRKPPRSRHTGRRPR
jgi:hypothetical protein